MKLFGRLTPAETAGKYINDRDFRRNVGVFGGIVLNFVYAVFKAVTGILYSSVFSVSMAVYYLILGLMRLGLAYSYRKKDVKGGVMYERHCYRRTAWFLFLLNIPMGGIIILMICTDPSVNYPGYTIYASATYTFYMMTLSVINLVKFRKSKSPILSSSKVLNFIAALMSVLGLQNALISTFSEDAESYRTMMNTLTGTAIYAIVIISALYMIIHARNTEKETGLNEQIGK